jgi:hypothetical protein
MSQALTSFLEQRLPLPGVAAWGLRSSDRTMLSGSYAEYLPPSRVEQTLGRLMLATESLQYHQVQPLQLCWVFEHLRVHLTQARNGAWLALFVENIPDLQGDAVAALLKEFRAEQTL